MDKQISGFCVLVGMSSDFASHSAQPPTLGWGPPMTLNDPPAGITGNISDFVMKESDIHIDSLRENFQDFMKGHFFHLSEMTGFLKVYKLGVLFTSTIRGESIAIFSFYLCHGCQM